MWSCTRHLRKLEGLYIHIPHGQRAGHRRAEISRVMEQLTQTIFMEKFHVQRCSRGAEFNEYERNTGILITDMF